MAKGIYIRGLSLFQRFIRKFNRNGRLHLTLGHCWEWTGYLDEWGYGRIQIGGKWERAHVISFIIYRHRPKNCVLHKCDNACCVNPDHLYDGTLSQNMLDAFSRGRKSHLGEKNPNSKLSDAETEYIRVHYRRGRGPYDLGNAAELTRMFKITRARLLQIARGE